MKFEKSLEERAWFIFAKYIKLRDTDQYGYGKCIDTGRRILYRIVDGKIQSTCDAGHYISRAVKTIMFNEVNVNAQYSAANRSQIFTDYHTRIENKWGKQSVEWLRQKEREWGNKADSLDDDYLRWVIKHYSDKVEVLLKDKMF